MELYHSPIPPNQSYSQGYWSAVISAVLYFLLSVILMVNMLGYFLGHYPQNFTLTSDQRTLILQTTSFVVWLAIGGVIFCHVIDISYANAVYFSDVTVLTVGFGDITPTTALGRGLVFPYAVIGIVMLGWSYLVFIALCSRSSARMSCVTMPSGRGRLLYGSLVRRGLTLRLTTSSDTRGESQSSAQSMRLAGYHGETFPPSSRR